MADKKEVKSEQKEPTLVDEINELEKEYVELEKEVSDAEKKAQTLKDKQFDVLKRLAPRQTAFLKAIINEQQTKIKDLEKESDSSKQSRSSNVQ